MVYFRQSICILIGLLGGSNHYQIAKCFVARQWIRTGSPTHPVWNSSRHS